jgi:hypothetical protein
MLGSIAEWLMKEVQPSDAATPVVSAFYDRFPFPGDPLQDGPPAWIQLALVPPQRVGLRAWRDPSGAAAATHP